MNTLKTNQCDLESAIELDKNDPLSNFRERFHFPKFNSNEPYIYFSGHSLWVMPIVISAPILLGRLAEISKLKKEKEVKDRYGLDQEEKDLKEVLNKRKSNWEDMSFGKKTDKR